MSLGPCQSRAPLSAPVTVAHAAACAQGFMHKQERARSPALHHMWQHPLLSLHPFSPSSTAPAMSMPRPATQSRHARTMKMKKDALIGCGSAALRRQGMRYKGRCMIVLCVRSHAMHVGLQMCRCMWPGSKGISSFPSPADKLTLASRLAPAFRLTGQSWGWCRV